MQTQVMEVAVETKNGTVRSVGRSSVLQPRTNYKGKGTKWYEDKPKQEDR